MSIRSQQSPAADVRGNGDPRTAPVAFARRRRYHADISRGDFFVIRHLKLFLESTLRECVRPGTEIADVGCGEQPLRSLIVELGGSYTGIDVGQNAHGTVDVLADVRDVPLPGGSFGVILCSEVLEHVSDTYGAFAELARLCKVGGVIIITTPFAYPLHEEPHDFVRLTPYQIGKCASMNDLEIVQLTTSGDELQVAATVWCNLWSRAGAGRRNPVRSAWNTLMRLPINLVVAALTPLVQPLLPRKYFLSTLCTLRKRG